MARRKEKLELDEEISRLYYTARQAQQILSMDKDRFNYIVKTRNIQRVPFLGGQGYYRRDEIDMLAGEIDAFLLAGGRSKFEFRPATFEDLESEDHMAYLNFGAGSISPERNASRRRYLEINPFTSFHLYNSKTLVALINLVPLKHEAVLEFRHGKRGWMFPSDMIEQFEPTDHRLECIVIDLATITSAPPEKRQRYGGYLLHKLSAKFVEWGSQGVDIQSIDACGGTIEGRKLLEHAGFKHTGTYKIPAIGKPEILSDRPMYRLDIDTSDLVTLRPYKKALARWREHQK